MKKRTAGLVMKTCGSIEIEGVCASEFSFKAGGCASIDDGVLYGFRHVAGVF